MGTAIETISNYMKHGRNAKETKSETCGELRARLRVGFPIGDRAFELRFAKLCGRNFATNRICTPEEVKKMEGAYPQQSEKLKRVSEEKPMSNVAPAPFKKVKKRIDWRKVWAVAKAKTPKVRTLVLLSSLVIPTLASVSNTFSVSHALSNSPSTAALITGVASATSLLFLWAGVKGVGAWFVVAATLGFEAFCNACAVFTSLMGSLAYGLTTVSGKPSNFLEMVANFTGKDHQDAATAIAIFTAAMICGAQVSALYELKK